MLLWRKGSINRTISVLQYFVLLLLLVCVSFTIIGKLFCTIIMVHNGMNSSYRSVDCIGL